MRKLVEPVTWRSLPRTSGETVAVVAGLQLLVADALPAHAYIDPGSGALLLQLLTAAFLGASYYVLRSWKRIRSFFSSHFGGKGHDSGQGQGTGE